MSSRWFGVFSSGGSVALNDVICFVSKCIVSGSGARSLRSVVVSWVFSAKRFGFSIVLRFSFQTISCSGKFCVIFDVLVVFRFNY